MGAGCWIWDGRFVRRKVIRDVLEVNKIVLNRKLRNSVVIRAKYWKKGVSLEKVVPHVRSIGEERNFQQN